MSGGHSGGGQPRARITPRLPAVHYGSWFDHVKGWLGQQQLLDIFYITYEELHRVSPVSPCPPAPCPSPAV